MKTPNEVLAYFIESLEQEQQFEFNMYKWFQTECDSPSVPYEVENVCGTSACIAGTVAYRLNPKSRVSCEQTIQQWIGLSVSDWSAEQSEAECALDAIFTSAILYGEVELIDITKEQAITLLNKLLSESHDTWESLYESIYEIKWGNQ
jgi:hypothetical protein